MTGNDFVIKVRLDLRPVLPVILLHMTEPRRLRAWYLMIGVRGYRVC